MDNFELRALRENARRANVITLLLEEIQEDIKDSTPPEAIITALVYEANLLKGCLEDSLINCDIKE